MTTSEILTKRPPSPSSKKEPYINAPPAKLANKTLRDTTVLTNKFITHHPKYGLNPLVDAAAYLFSIIGKLKQIKSYRHLSKLQKELIQEINHFQEAAKSQGYSSEYILVTRYALCATLDDVVGNTLWGGQGQWDNYNMLTVFNQDAMNHERFFIVLERIIKDPAQYIDVMEFMYICLSLGFKGHYRSEFGNNQLEQITNSLYKRIRHYRGDHSQALAPFPIKAQFKDKSLNHAIPLWMIMFATIGSIFVIFLCLGYMLDSISKEAHQELMHIGNSLLYETHHS
jgi:type VI secretion system protein ImpK